LSPDGHIGHRGDGAHRAQDTERLHRYNITSESDERAAVGRLMGIKQGHIGGWIDHLTERRKFLVFNVPGAGIVPDGRAARRATAERLIRGLGKEREP
jgi:hypothetical protein